MAPKRDDGMILVVVILIAGLLLLTGLSIWQTNQSDLSLIKINVRRVQASFLAKGALQLALLKARLFPTPLYDAVAYSVGKNPYYVHSRGYDHLYEDPPATPDQLARLIPGPAFLTGEVSLDSGNLLRTNTKNIPGRPGGPQQGDDLNSEDGLSGSDYVCDRYLNYFIQDVSDRSFSSAVMSDPPEGTVAGQPALSISTAASCPILGDEDPYEGKFRILTIAVQGQRDNRLYGEETIRVIAEAEIWSTMAGISDSWKQREETIYKVRRRY